MATRSTIAILTSDGAVKSVYAHFDGYLSGNGFMLYKNYQDVEKVKKLISLGSLSSLRAEIDLPQGVAHNNSQYYKDVTVFYSRDRNEKDVDASQYSSLADYLINGDFQRYDYIFHEKNNQWYLIDMNTQALVDLKSAILGDEDVSEEAKVFIQREQVFKDLSEDLERKKLPQKKIKI